MESKQKWDNEQGRNRLRHGEPTHGRQGEGLGEETGSPGIGVYALLYLTWVANKDVQA